MEPVELINSLVLKKQLNINQEKKEKLFFTYVYQTERQ